MLRGVLQTVRGVNPRLLLLALKVTKKRRFSIICFFVNLNLFMYLIM